MKISCSTLLSALIAASQMFKGEIKSLKLGLRKLIQTSVPSFVLFLIGLVQLLIIWSFKINIQTNMFSTVILIACIARMIMKYKQTIAIFVLIIILQLNLFIGFIPKSISEVVMSDYRLKHLIPILVMIIAQELLLSKGEIV